MNINFRGKDTELTEDLQSFAEKKLQALEKLLGDGEITVHVDFSKDSNHHKKAEVYRAAVEIVGPGMKFFTEETAKDYKTAVNQVKQELQAQIKAAKGNNDAKRRDAARTARFLKESA